MQAAATAQFSVLVILTSLVRLAYIPAACNDGEAWPWLVGQAGICRIDQQRHQHSRNGNAPWVIVH